VKLPAKETLDRFMYFASLAQKAILVVGVWILFCYCLSEQIMPDGLSIGDAMTLIMVALSFGVVMTVGIAYGMFAALAPVQFMLAIVNAIKKENKPSFTTLWRGKIMTSMSVMFLLLIALLVLMSMSTGTASDMKFGRTVGCFIVIGMMLLCFFAVKRDDDKPRGLAWNLTLGALAIFAPILTIHPAVMNITMTALGIRSAAGSLIVIDASQYPKIDEVLTQSGLNVHFCQLPKSGNWATTDARVVWHGVGNTSYVAFLDRPSAGQHTIATPIPKNSLQVIRPGHWEFDCDKTLTGKAVTPLAG
jgi:hypothetical protein